MNEAAWVDNLSPEEESMSYADLISKAVDPRTSVDDLRRLSTHESH